MAYQYAEPPAAPGAASPGAVAAAPYAPAPAQYAAPYGYGYGYPPYVDPNELRTLFLTGFPSDVKERELNNLLRFLPGYEASQLHLAGVKSPQAQGFALFDCGASAQGALHRITNLVFDDGHVLRCEMARKNMYIKDDSSTKRSRYDGQYSAYGGYGGYGYGAPPQPQGYQAVSNTKDNPPCNTLFIGNLGDATDENEIRSLFSSQPGFRQIKLNRGQRGITCFVEFSDVASAMAVHQSQQGAVPASSDRGGIRIQYSKNPFGKKRDYGSFNDQSPYSPGPVAAYDQSGTYQAAPQGEAAPADAPAYDQQQQQQQQQPPPQQVPPQQVPPQDYQQLLPATAGYEQAPNGQPQEQQQHQEPYGGAAAPGSESAGPV